MLSHVPALSFPSIISRVHRKTYIKSIYCCKSGRNKPVYGKYHNMFHNLPESFDSKICNFTVRVCTQWRRNEFAIKIVRLLSDRPLDCYCCFQSNFQIDKQLHIYTTLTEISFFENQFSLLVPCEIHQVLSCDAT